MFFNLVYRENPQNLKQKASYQISKFSGEKRLPIQYFVAAIRHFFGYIKNCCYLYASKQDMTL